MEFKQIEAKIKNFGKNVPTYWGCALAGEVGETCNIIKKLECDGMDAIDKKTGERFIDLLPAELADVFIYTSLTAKFFNIDLESVIIKKLAEIDIKRFGAGKNLHVETINGVPIKTNTCPKCGRVYDAETRMRINAFETHVKICVGKPTEEAEQS
jgi:NTP pyrophosphatase (non-canonical NTP hydrolase)